MDILVNAINEYETNFKGWLKTGQYESNEEFLNDLKQMIDFEGIKNILEYYNSCYTMMNPTNSTLEQQNALYNLISLITIK